jgi:alkanesulfonate monooxygenase
MPARFHWSLSQAGDPWRRAQATAAMAGVLNLQAQIELCRHAEQNGIESMLMAFSFARPDPLILATAIGAATEKIVFLVACRSGIFSPTAFVQQVNTFSSLTNGRIAINVVVGHSPHEQAYYGDFLGHDERYQRTEEFLDVCAGFWRQDGPVDFVGRHYRIEGGKLNTPFVSPYRPAPEIYLGGNSEQAEKLAIKHASCLFRYPDAPREIGERAQPLLAAGKEIGLRVAVLGRPTRDEALAAARELVEIAREKAQNSRREFVGRTDSVAFRSTLDLSDRSEWVTPFLWTGMVPYMGEACLVGSADDIAAALLEYREAGVTQFLLSGWPDLEQIEFFGREILPRVRALEAAQGT